MKAIVVSTQDIAGMNMLNFFLKKGFELTGTIFEGHEVFKYSANGCEWELITTDSPLVNAEHLNDLQYDEMIFASRHSSSAQQATLTVHACGNFGPADYGGKPGELSVASASTMCNIYSELVKKPPEGYGVSLEVTHHGPFIDIPHCWAELGSCEKQWKNEEAAEYLVGCIIHGIQSDAVTPVVIGIGGNHYCSVFSKLEGQYAFGHILPKYAQDYLNLKMINQMIEKTMPKPVKIVMDKKGVSQQSKVREMLEKAGVEIELI